MSQSKQENRKTIIKLSLLFVLSLASFVACNPSDSIPTPFDVTPNTLTSTLCPEILIASSGTMLNKPVYIALSVEDDTGSQWEYASDSYDIISNVLSEVTEPGDSIVVFRLGPIKFKDALVFNASVGSASHPNLPPTLTLIPSVTATTTPVSTPDQILFQRMTQVLVEGTQSEIVLTATQIEILNVCGKAGWENDFSGISTQWAVTRAAAKDTFDNFLPTLGTPDIEDQEIYGNQVFEGLQHVTLAFNTECDKEKYRRCIFIVFSNLSEYRVEPPAYLEPPIDLHNVEVVSVMLNCKVLFDPDCKSTQEKWQTIYSSLGAKSSDFMNDEDIENKLNEFIRR